MSYQESSAAIAEYLLMLLSIRRMRDRGIKHHSLPIGLGAWGPRPMHPNRYKYNLNTSRESSATRFKAPGES